MEDLVEVQALDLHAPQFIVSGMSAEVQNTLEGWDGETLPESIDSLIDNKAYRNRVKWLAKVHGLKYMEKLAELARREAVGKPSRYFAKAYSVKNWHEKTLQILEDLFQLEGFVLESVGSISEKTKKFVFYIMGTVRQIGVEKFQEILGRVKHAENPEHYLFGALNLARQEVAESGGRL